MKNCNSRIPKILVLLFSVMFLFFSCSDIFSTREETGSVTFSLSPELIKAVANACRAADNDGPSIAPGPVTNDEAEGESQGKYKFEISLKGGYEATQAKSSDELETLEEKLKTELFRFENIPSGVKIHAEAKIIVNEESVLWPVMKGISDEVRIQSGENTLSFKLYQTARCEINNIFESDEELGVIERISVYALPNESNEADAILGLVAEDNDLNDFAIKTKLESCKDMLVGDYFEGDSNLSKELHDGYHLKDGGKYYFLTLVYIKNGPVYLGHPQFEGTDPELAEKALTTISLGDINKINLSLMELYLDIAEADFHFLFWDDEKNDYVELKDNEDFKTQTIKNDDNFDKNFDNWAIKALELGYEINERKSGEAEYDEEAGKYVVYVYFDKITIEDLLTLKGSASDTNKYPGTFIFTIYSNLTYDITYSNNSGSVKDKVVSKGSIVSPDDEEETDSSVKIDDSKASSPAKFIITEKKYFDFTDMSSDTLLTIEKPTSQNVDISEGSFVFTSASGAVITFAIAEEPEKPENGPFPFVITLTPPSDVKASPESITVYGVNSSIADQIKKIFASSSDEKSLDLANILDKHNDAKASEVTYFGNYKSGDDTLKVSTDGKITITDSFPSWGVMGKGKSVAIVALANYGDGVDITAYCMGCSSVLEVNSKENKVNFDLNKIEIPCDISFFLDEEVAEEYTGQVTLSSFTPSSDSKAFTELVMKEAAEVIKKITADGYEYDTMKYGDASGIPYVSLYFKKAEAPVTNTESGISVKLDEVETSDLAEKFTVTAEEVNGDIVATATPETVVNGYEYQWWLDGEQVDGGTASSYRWTETALEMLAPGVHYIMLEIIYKPDTTGTNVERYSATLTFTLTSSN